MTANVQIDGVTKSVPDTLPERDYRESWVWNGDALEVNWANAVANFRAKAKMPKTDFLQGAAEKGIISWQDAEDAAVNVWPQPFANAIGALPAEEQSKARILWPSIIEISRNADLLALFVAARICTDRQLDTLFGYSGQYPS